jgi:hypothetical protein
VHNPNGFIKYSSLKTNGEYCQPILIPEKRVGYCLGKRRRNGLPDKIPVFWLERFSKNVEYLSGDVESQVNIHVLFKCVNQIINYHFLNTPDIPI